MTHVEAWLAGEYTTAELDCALHDPEYLRYLSEGYIDRLIYRYGPIIRND